MIWPSVWRSATQLQASAASLLGRGCPCLLHVRGLANTPEQQSQLELLERTGLPLAQRCKNLLAGNWRGQLSTAEQDPEKPAVHSALVRYLSPRGSLPYVFLNKEADRKDIQNLAMEDRASLTVGHTDPLAVVAVMRAAGLMPARANVFGRLVQLPAGEMAYVLRTAEKASVPGMPPLADTGDGADAHIAYRVEPMSIRYVDTKGHKHVVDVNDVDGALLDQLAVGQHALLGSINQNTELRSQMAAFCQAYLQTPAEDALMIQADRLGFTVLGRTQIDDGSGKPQWREYRFQLTRELADAAALQQMLAEMRVEVESGGR